MLGVIGTPQLQKYDHCEFTDLVKNLLTQHCSLSNGHIHVTKAYPVCPYTLHVQAIFLWGFYEKEQLQIPGCLTLTASSDHSPSTPLPSQVQLCRPTTVTAYSQLCWVQHRASCYLWQSFQALEAANKEHSVMESKMIPGPGVLTTQLHLADMPRCKRQAGEPNISTENTWSQNWKKIYLEDNSLQEAVTCTDVKPSVFRVTLHILHIWCHWKRDVFILSAQTHTPTHPHTPHFMSSHVHLTISWEPSSCWFHRKITWGWG